MITEFTDKFIASEAAVKARFAEAHPGSYQDIVRIVIETISAGDNPSYEDRPDPERIHRIDDGDYQGTLVFVIGAEGYQPSDYWCVFVGYGSCSGCDTLQRIRDWGDDKPNAEQIKDYYTLALHVAQRLRKM